MTKEKVGILMKILGWIKDKLNVNLGPCDFCKKEMRWNDELFGNKYTHENICKPCYDEYIKPDLDRLRSRIN